MLLSSVARWLRFPFFFFFNDTATTEIYTLSLHDALPISSGPKSVCKPGLVFTPPSEKTTSWQSGETPCGRSEEHTSELQSRLHLVCRLLLEKKKNNKRVAARQIQSGL